MSWERGAAGAIAAACAFTGPPALARDVASAGVAAIPSAALFVELVVNGVDTGTLAQLRLDGPRLWLDAALLRQSGVAVEGTGPIDAAHLAGITARYDPLDQRLALDVAPDLLPVRHIAAERRAPVAAVADTGALLAYDFYGEHGARGSGASLWTEQRLFGGFGVLSNTGTLSAARGRPARYVRFDTSYRYVDPARMLTATAGDLFSNALSWSSSVRIGGLQIARSFASRPDLVTTPLPRFAGQTAVPTGVQLFVDGYRQSQTDVAPGRFVLDDIPVVNGAGDVTVVTTDAVGRQVTTTVPFYVAPELLRPGLVDFSAEVGALRRGYGIRSLDYGAAVVSGSLRRGMTPRLTLEGHAEGSARLAAIGGGLVWSPGLIGALRGAVVASRREGRDGRQLSLGYSYTNRRLSLGFEHIAQSARFADLASFDLAQWRGGMRTDRASASLALSRLGSVSLAYIDARGRDAFRARLASASWSRALGRRFSAFANVNYDLGRHEASGQVRLLLSFGHASASAGISADRERGAVAQVSYAQAVPQSGGLGIAADAASGFDGRAYGQVSAAWRARSVLLEGGAAATPGGSTAHASATGALVAMDGAVFTAAAVPDAFAVVATGAAGVPVHYENQLVGTTGRGGHLFIPSVTAFHPAHYAIDTLSLGADAVADRIERAVALRPGSGAVVHLTVSQSRSAVVQLVDVSGKPLAAGGEAQREGATATLIGWDGLTALDHAPVGRVALAVTRHDGGTCRAQFDVPAALAPFARIGPVPCR